MDDHNSTPTKLSDIEPSNPLSPKGFGNLFSVKKKIFE